MDSSSLGISTIKSPSRHGVFRTRCRDGVLCVLVAGPSRPRLWHSNGVRLFLSRLVSLQRLGVAVSPTDIYIGVQNFEIGRTRQLRAVSAISERYGKMLGNAPTACVNPTLDMCAAPRFVPARILFAIPSMVLGGSERV